MEVCRRSSWLLSLLGVILLAEALQGVQGEVEIGGPSETQCRPYIEKALRELETVGAGDAEVGQSSEETTVDNISLDDEKSDEQRSADIFENENENETQESKENEAVASSQIEQQVETETKTEESSDLRDKEDEENVEQPESLNTESGESLEVKSTEDVEDGPETSSADQPEDTTEEIAASEAGSTSASVETLEDTASQEETEEQTLPELSPEETEFETQKITENGESFEALEEAQQKSTETNEAEDNQSTEEVPSRDENYVQQSENDSKETIPLDTKSDENETSAGNESATLTTSSDEDNKSSDDESTESNNRKEPGEQQDNNEDVVNLKQNDSAEESQQKEDIINVEQNQKSEEEDERSKRSVEGSDENESNDKSTDNESAKRETGDVTTSIDTESTETKETQSVEQKEEDEKSDTLLSSKEDAVDPSISTGNQNSPNSKEETIENETEKSKESEESLKQVEHPETTEDTENESNSNIDSTENAPEEDLVIETDVPENLRPRDYVEQLLKLDREATKTEEIVDRVAEITLRELKRLYDNAIKPLETLYKYRDLSNRHYGDAEIFSKPLILFMGPWSGGKSTIINYLLNIEYNDTALRTGAEPSPAYFNLLMHGAEEEILDGTQLAADYTFSGLQKFGQGLEERLRGIKLPSKLLEKVNIAEIPGILEVRKQVSRVFPFNDACQWFIDRADIIFLVYDPSKLDVGPETEAILDQLKGREYQTRIVLNKADQIKPEELMRVQGALIWNISPLMSSPQPPVMYTTSLWSRPYEHWAPVRLLQSQERAFLRDLRSAVDKRIDNKIASARRFAVRVRNHAKMVDCYLTTYYNHKSIFGNRKQVADTIIEHPQDYHIYEGLSTLTNISRYDLPDPDVYKDFFRLNPLYEFQQLSATCTYFRGCPINKLDVAIAYDFPELVGKHKRLVETALAESSQDQQAQGS